MPVTSVFENPVVFLCRVVGAHRHQNRSPPPAVAPSIPASHPPILRTSCAPGGARASTMGAMNPVALLALALGLTTPAAAAASRQLQEGTAGTCLFIATISGKDFQAGQDAVSLQVGAQTGGSMYIVLCGCRHYRGRHVAVSYFGSWDTAASILLYS